MDGEQWFEIKFDFILRHLENDQISLSIVVKSKTGISLTIPTNRPLTLDEGLLASDVGETETKCLGSLVSRWTRGPHVTESRYMRKPLFESEAILPGLRSGRQRNFVEDGNEKKFEVSDDDDDEDFGAESEDDDAMDGEWAVI